jgi:hypothetical protein
VPPRACATWVSYASFGVVFIKRNLCSTLCRYCKWRHPWVSLSFLEALTRNHSFITGAALPGYAYGTLSSGSTYGGEKDERRVH